MWSLILEKKKLYVYSVLSSTMHVLVKARDPHWESSSAHLHFIFLRQDFFHES